MKQEFVGNYIKLLTPFILRVRLGPMWSEVCSPTDGFCFMSFIFSVDSVDVTSEPDDQDVSVAAASHNPNKGQLEVQLGGAVTLQCPQGKRYERPTANFPWAQNFKGIRFLGGAKLPNS